MQLQPHGRYFHKKKLTLQHALKMQRGVMVELYLFFNLGTRLGQMSNATPRPLYTQVKALAPIHSFIVQENVRTGLDNIENLTLTTSQTLNGPACSKSLYRLQNVPEI